MERKKILVVDKSFAVGGIQTSLMNMLSIIKEDYDVTLFMYNPQGPIKERLPEGINLLQPSWMIEACGMSFMGCMKKGSFKQKTFRMFATIWTKLFDNGLPLKLAIKNQPYLGDFDIAIAYHHEVEKKSLTSGFIRLVNEKCSAGLKISWIHNDSKGNDLDEEYNDKYYQLADRIVTVSDSVKEGFIYKHPALKQKVVSFYNFLNYRKIVNLSEEEFDYNEKENTLICFSACRLEEIKGIPRAIHAISSTMHSNDIKWYIAGDGNKRKEIELAIEEENLEDKIILLGNQTNPYKFMKKADLVLLVSYHEAAPMVYMEAEFLGIPVFSTELASSREMLNEANSFICENSEEGIKSGFEKVVLNAEVIRKMKQTKDDDANVYIMNKKREFEKLITK